MIFKAVSQRERSATIIQPFGDADSAHVGSARIVLRTVGVDTGGAHHGYGLKVSPRAKPTTAY